MEGSLDDLIRYLLEEIALCGDQGALPSHVLSRLNHYFQRNIHDGALANTIDCPFQDQAWKWLARHPEIKIGRHGEANHMNLGDIVAHNDRVTKTTQQGVANLTTASTSLTADHGLVDPQANVAATEDERGISGGAESPPLQVASFPLPSDIPSYLHVFASVNLMWMAVAGHGVDNEKIAALEFTCLSVIAARRENGILQPELVRVTGQDKRSVPWRTQKLCDRGYIVKKDVVASGSRTSLCILKRFVVPNSSKDVTAEGQYPRSLPESVNAGEDQGYIDPKFHVIETRLRATFDILKELRIIVWDDLKMKLGIWRIAPDSRRYALTIRKLEMLKCVQRVKASDEKNGAFHRCVKFLREPTKEEYDMLCNTKHKLSDFMPEKEHDDSEVDLENDSIDSPAQVGDESDTATQLNNDALPAKVLLWTPDRLMVNILRDAVGLSGSKGMSSMDIKNTVIGVFFERPLENLLTRLVEVWQLSQPLHLRYLALLRDISFRGKTQHYVYYEYDAFKSLVDAGKASWEAVETVIVDNPENQSPNAAPNAIPDVDHYGFPKLDKARFQGRDNNATLAGSQAAAKIAKFRVTALDASITTLKDDRYTANRGSIREYRKSKPNRPSIGQGDNKDAAFSDAERRKSRAEKKHVTKGPKLPKDPEEPKKPLGRPRKHPKAGLPEDVSGLTLKQLYAIKASQRAAVDYERTKITNMIASHIELGIEETDSTEYVLAEVAARNKANPDPAVSEALESLATTARKRKRPTIEEASYKSVTYLPSVLAHSFLVPKSSEVKTSASTLPAYAALEPSIRPQKKVKFLMTGENEKISSPYLPSILAHSLLARETSTISPSKSAAATTLDDLISRISKQPSPKKSIGPRKRLYRSKKFDSAVEYFPSTIAHTNPNLASISQPATKTRKSSLKPLNGVYDFGILSPNHAFPGSGSIPASTSGLHERNSGDRSKPMEMSVGSLQSLHSIGTQSDTPPASSAMLQRLVQQVQTIAPSISHKRPVDDEPYLESHTAPKRRRTSLFSSLSMARVIESGNYESKIGYLPSVAAHTHLCFVFPEAECLMAVAATAKKIPRPRKKTAKALEVEIMDQMIANSISAQSPQRVRPVLSYEEQLESIARVGIGVYLGKPALLKKSHGRGRPCQCRLLVFRSPSLSFFSWFISKSTLPEATITEPLLPVRQDMLKELEVKALSSVPRPLFDTSRPHFQLSQTRDKFLSSVRDAIRLSKLAELSKSTELSYSTSYPAIADGPSPSVASRQSRKRKRNSTSTDTRQPLRKKTNIDIPSRDSSQPEDLSPERATSLLSSTTFKEGMSSNAELANLVPSEEHNIVQSAYSIHAPSRGSNLSESTFEYTSTSCTSNVVQLSTANLSDGLDLSASLNTIVYDRIEDTAIFDASSSISEDVGVVRAQYNDAADRTREDKVSPTGTTSIIQNVAQDTFLPPSAPELTVRTPTNESNLAKSKEVRYVNADTASTITECDTVSLSFGMDHERPESGPNTNSLNSWLPGNSEQTHDSLLEQNSVTPGFEASAGIRNVSSLVISDTISNQEEEKESLDAMKDTASHTPVEATIESLQDPEFVLESSLQASTFSKAAPTIVKVTTTGGSVAVLRRKIIMEIIEQCGGVFPGDREIWVPFCDVWKTRIGGGKPDHRTVLAAIKYLVDNGKLRKLKFTFSHEGVATTRSIVTSPDISPTDPKVKNLREKMMSHVDTSSRPKPYIPEEAMIFITPVEVVDKPISKPNPPNFLNRAWTNCLEVAEEQVKLQYPARLKRSSDGLLILQAMEKRRKEKEARQVRSLEDVEEEMSEPDAEIEGTHQFRWRKLNSATDKKSSPKSKGTARMRKATLAECIAGSSTTRTNTNTRRLNKLHVKSRPRPNFLNQSIAGGVRRSGQTSNQFANLLAGSTYKQLRFMEVMDQHSNFDKELTPEPADIDQGQNWWLLADRGRGGLDPPGESDLLSIQPKHQRTKVRKLKANKTHKIFQEQLQQIGLQYRVAARQKKTKFMMTNNPGKSPLDLTNLDLQVSPLMDPEHLFHVTTGTFSTSFTGMLDVAEVPDLLEDPCIGSFHDPIEEIEVDLPHSLQDALSRPYDIELVTRMERLVRVGLNPNHDPFLELVDRIRKWELGTPNLANAVSKDWKFINFQLPGRQETINGIFQTSVFIDPGLGGGMKQSRQKNFTAASPRPVVPAKRPAPGSKQPARSANLARSSTAWRPAIKAPVDADARAIKKITLRGPRLQAVSSEDDDRILVAVLLVRILVGGSEQHIDWVLLARMFGSKFSERLLHRRWVVVRVRYKCNLEALQSEIQDMFLHAYENGTIPPLNFDNYDDYDWDSLVEWTIKNLETPLHNLNKDLPDTRAELDGLFELRKPSVAASEMALFYELESLCSVPRRQVVIHQKPNVIAAHTPSIDRKESTLHDNAKTWVRANVMTSDQGYDAKLARNKLISLGEPAVEAAVKDLLAARVILHANKGRLLPGRNYDITDYCLTRLRRKIDAETFRQAAAYKACLDLKFEEEGSVAFSYHTQDAEVMAVLNLAAYGRISILPKNPPMETFGLVDNGYRTRHMDKARLDFDIELQPTASYVGGNPLLPLPPPPGSVFCTFSFSSDDVAQSRDISVEAEPTMERFPFWVGINNMLVPAAWDLALAAVLSLVVVQPGVSPSEVAKTLRPALEVWEVELVFQWCVQAGVVTWSDEQAGKSRNGGVKVAEWWWLVYGTGEAG